VIDHLVHVPVNTVFVAEPDAQRYFEFHRERYRFLLETAAPFLDSGARVLDIGLSALPRLLLQRFPRVELSTLGFDDRRYRSPGEWPHFDCDLNDPAFAWASLSAFDLIICAEVIEHLHSPPERILRLLAGALRPGGRLILQTPNAASLEKRVKLLCGRIRTR